MAKITENKIKNMERGKYNYERIALDLNFSHCSEVEERKIITKTLLAHKGSGVAFETCGKFITKAMTESETVLPYEMQTVLLQQKIYSYIVEEYDLKSVEDFISFFKSFDEPEYQECAPLGRRCITFKADVEEERNIGLMLKGLPSSDRTMAIIMSVRNYLVHNDDEEYLSLSAEKLLSGLSCMYHEAEDNEVLLTHVLDVIDVILTIGGQGLSPRKTTAEDREFQKYNDELKDLFE